MKQNFLLSVCALILIGCCDPVFADRSFPEPPFKWLVGFNTEEIPGKAGLYYDIDDDGRPELVTAHTIIKVERVAECKPPIKTQSEIWIGQECDTHSPKVYVLDRRIFAVRMVDEKWAVVIERTCCR